MKMMFQTPDNNQRMEDYQHNEINFLDHLLVILKRKRMIFRIVGSVFILSIIVSLLLPKRYVATARILPPQESGSLHSMVGGSLGVVAYGLLGVGSSSSDIYVGILKSCSVADRLIDKFNLLKIYHIKSMTQMYSKLSDISSFDVDNKSLIISISVEDRDPQMAAELANGYIEALDFIKKTVNITEEQRKRIFLENRRLKVKDDLIKAETDLKFFRQRYKLVSIDEQAKATIEGAANITAEIIATQTELEVLKDFGTQKQNEAVMLQAKINELRKQLSIIESGGGENKFYIPFNEFPGLTVQLTRLMREFKIQENLFELLTNQYEMAKLEEAKDMDTILVLDKAIPPDKKMKPRRNLIVITCTFMALFASAFAAFICEFIEKKKIEDEERYVALVRDFLNRYMVDVGKNVKYKEIGV